MKIIRGIEPTDNYIYVNPESKYAGQVISIGNHYYECKSANEVGKNEMRLNKIQRSELNVNIDDELKSHQIKTHSWFQTDDSSDLRLIVNLYKSTAVCIYEEEFRQNLITSLNNVIIFSGKRLYIFSYQKKTFLLTNLSDKNIKIGPGINIAFEIGPNPRLTMVRDNINQFRNFSRKSMEELGIGGLQNEYEEILRRVFNSRMVDSRLLEELGLKHVKGAILYGPPGTGKTLLSKQFSSLIGNIDPIVVNGPEILNKYVGQSEENIRKLFEPAKKNPGKVTVIIFDEIDAICKERGRGSGGASANDGVVNQLLAMMDGVKPLDNILVIGITNRMELLDSALLRPGRFEVHLRINLPNIKGRYEIFNIYLKTFHDSNRLAVEDAYEDYLMQLARMTHNYSGAEISGVIRSATSYALNREVNWDDDNKKMVKDVKLTHEDIMQGIQEVKPQWAGKQGGLPSRWEDFVLNDLTIQSIFERLEKGEKVLLNGKSKTGKTQYLVELSNRLSSSKYILYINKDLEKALDGIEVVRPDYIFIDDILDLVGYVSLGCRYYTNTVLRLRNLLKGKIPIVGTVNDFESIVLEQLGILEHFDETMELMRQQGIEP